MADLIVDSEEYFAAREAADLLARVRSECDVYYDPPSHIKGVVIMCRDEAFLRELAEALRF